MKKISTILCMIGALFGMTSIVLSAVGAHLLKPTISPEDYDLLETALQYLMIHSVLLVAIRDFWIARTIIVIGLVFFSGSFILKAFSHGDFSTSLAPVGGSCLILGWLVLFLTFAMHLRHR